MIKNVLLVALGGGFGSVARYLISFYIQKNSDGTFPWATLIVNILGSFIIGILYGLSERGHFMSSEIRLLLAVGVCGGFTTFSTFTNENFILIRGGEFLHMALYTGFSIALGFSFVYIGYSLTNLIR